MQLNDFRREAQRFESIDRAASEVYCRCVEPEPLDVCVVCQVGEVHGRGMGDEILDVCVECGAVEQGRMTICGDCEREIPEARLA